LFLLKKKKHNCHVEAITKGCVKNRVKGGKKKRVIGYGGENKNGFK